MSDQEPTLYPPWRQALHDLELSGMQPGQVIEHAWLKERFGIKPPTTIAEAEKNAAIYWHFVRELRKHLLEKHLTMWRPIGGVGYRVVEPEEQTSTAMRDRGAEVMSALGRMMDEISYVQTDKLDDAARKANSDAVAKVGVLMGMVKKKLGHQ